MTQLSRVLVANRGEIALRVIRGVQALGLEAVAVYSEVDAGSLAVQAADHAVPIGAPPPGESYLDIEKVIAAARATGADGIHPGYGFLSENADFAQAVAEAGITFLGPTPESIRLMGDKTQAGDQARASGVPTVPAFTPSPEATVAEISAAAEKLGTPLMIKAAAGGGGKGMRIARDLAEVPEMVEAAQREAQTAFGDARVFLERYIERARHVEIQVVGDGKGGALTLGARDCSLQRRHQKLIEESPVPAVPAAVIQDMETAASNLVQQTQYRGAGTVEFILETRDGDSGHAFFFLEMNTRLQVEHPVTELVQGVDLVALQVAIARGESWDPDLEQRSPSGHAIEVRVYAENPGVGFLPSIGTLTEVVWPQGPGIRVDAGVASGDEVTLYYDPLLAKIISYGVDRDQAIARMRRALAETFIAGVETSLEFCREILDSTAFRSSQMYTTLIEDELSDWAPREDTDAWQSAAIEAALHLTAGGPVGGGPPKLPTAWESLRDWRHDS